MRKAWIGASLLLMTSLVSARGETPLERGSYLVNALMACDACHTPPGPQGMSRRFSGGPQTWDTAAYTVKGSNISQDKDTGIGAWSEADLARALSEGIRPNGIPIAPQMPYAFYKAMTPDDLKALVAYVRTVPATRNEVQPPQYKAAFDTHLVPGAETSVGDVVPTDPVKRGFYLATLGHCMECHARNGNEQLDFQNNWGGGGSVMKGPFGTAVVANITSHPTKGIGAWSDDDIKTVLTKGTRPDGRQVAPPMARQGYFSKLTPQDLDALVAWVRSLPPKG